MRMILAGLLLALQATADTNSIVVAQEPDPISAAAHSVDVTALHEFARHARSDAERELANGIAAAFLNDEARAEALLVHVIDAAELSAERRALAASTLAGQYLRQTRFPQATQLLMRERDLLGGHFNSQDEERSFVFASALAGLPQMHAQVPANGQTPVRIDRGHLARVEVDFEGQESEAVVDTGASFSTVTQSEADRLGIRMLPDRVMVGSAAGQVLARLGVADRFILAGAEFRDVPFIVLPDKALSFAGGLFRIRMIIGLPVLLKLGRISISKEGGRTVLEFASGAYSLHREANLLLDGLRPLVRANVNGEMLRFLVDTGAGSSLIFRSALAVHPGLGSGGLRRPGTMAGAGGGSRDENALQIDGANFEVAGQVVPIAQLRVLGEERGSPQGLLGQDVMFSGKGFILDFRSMRLELIPDTTAPSRGTPSG